MLTPLIEKDFHQQRHFSVFSTFSAESPKKAGSD